MSSSPDPRSPARGRDTARESAPPANARVAPAHDRVVIHLDLDAFYAQVETKRLGLDPAQPLAVQQWQGIIAVNHPARDAGIRRHHTAAEARRLCPTIALVHVETIGDEDDVDHEDESDSSAAGGGDRGPDGRGRNRRRRARRRRRAVVRLGKCLCSDTAARRGKSCRRSRTSARRWSARPSTRRTST